MKKSTKEGMSFLDLSYISYRPRYGNRIHPTPRNLSRTDPAKPKPTFYYDSYNTINPNS